MFPLFNGTYLEQWLLYNRNRKDKGVQSNDNKDTTSVQRVCIALVMVSGPDLDKVGPGAVLDLGPQGQT